MKKRLFMSGLLFATVMCFMMSFTAVGAWDCDSLGHFWDYSNVKYEYYDDNYHSVIYQCTECGAIKSNQRSHEWLDDEDEHESYDDDYHCVVYKCEICGATKQKLERHKWIDEADQYEPYDNQYHYACYECLDCDNHLKKLEKHDFDDWDEECTRKASIVRKGIIERQCNECEEKIEESFSWKYGDENCLSYDIIDHSPVYKNSTSITVKLERATKGAVLRVTIDGKKYEKKLKDESKKVTVKLKKSKYGSKIKIELLYKGKVIGKDKCEEWDNVLYAKDIKKGMTKKQVKYLYYWGGTDDTASASGGWSYWYYDDGSYIIFKKGKVYAWYNAVG